jgi:acyl-CoA reductase-like NAD-dependent aldehyde dehydrogenase
MKLYPLIVAGQDWSGETTSLIHNPWTGQSFAEVPVAGPEQLEQALAAAAAARAAMRAASRHERSQWCARIADGLQRESETIALGITEESGKPITAARGEVVRGIATFRLASQEALRLAGEVVPIDIGASSEGYLGYTSRVACGPVAAITPFNFPLNLVAHKVAPALAVGNPVILKPAPATPLTALRLGKLVREAGVPEGAFSCLHLEVPEIEALVDDPRIGFVSFTGSARVGWQLKSRVPRKKVALELGGNAAVVVHEDANLDFAVPRLAVGGYAYAGQVCISVQRIYVQRNLYTEFKQRYLEAVGKLGVGDPSLESTVVGPLIRPGEIERLTQWIEEARQEGASVLCGGRADGAVFLPTVLEGVARGSRICQQEVFGPVTLLEPYDKFEDALKAVNDSEFGLQVGIFTRDLERILQSHDQLEVGAVIVNDFPTFRVDNMPYGGVKGSGFGREGVAYTMQEMTEPRLLVIRRG